MRNRRNSRRKNKVKEIIFSKNFIITCIILISVSVMSFTLIKARQAHEIAEMAKKAEELDRQTGEIFTAIETDLLNQGTNNTTEKVYTVNIAAVGDILCQMDMINDAYKGGEYDFSNMFDEVSGFIKNSDIAIGTLETNFTANTYSGTGKYNSPIEFLKAVKGSGISLVSLAHNHILDYKESGYYETIEKIKNENVDITGIPNNNENVEFTGIIKEINGIKIAFLGYTYGLSNSSSLTDEEKQLANIYTEELASKDIEYAKQNSDYIIAIMHWGNVNDSTISSEQRQITTFLVSQGIDMILGAHPSVIEPMEIVQDSEGKNILVAYSLGNYISAFKYEDADVELILNIQISKTEDSDKAVLQKVDYTPIYVLDNGTKAENRFELTDMKKLIRDYANGDTSRISKSVYNSLLTKLEKLQKLLAVEE